ncbi:GBF-interacting protein 1-like protein isoform X2 [Cinnamomum micranthum f. kanehirae]|uniref:GBF-interacting protein 1-like protein isoform X2 n=1 Tax=Cinnamomum micranthum f. kanehirae TaxID=337451 RepID=A0A3S3QDF9_9MAGN|nr:GBF-interacting protein 1-like protein isoform X2 [Cinnamomum micranthum f. kanehirae]
MENRSWLWRKKSSEKSPGETESSGSVSSHSERFSDDQVYCETVSSEGLQRQPYRFKVAYDKLVIASGSEPLTFNINGVKEHASFLREVQHAQEIRKKLLLNLMLSENPVKDISGAVSSAGAGLQQLSLQQEISAPPAGDNPAVIIPSHMQVPTPDCSHLSFGSFGPGNSAGFSASFLSKTLKSISDEASTAPDDSSVEHLDSRNHETSKENVGPPSSSQPEVLKQDGAVEATHGYQYPLPSSQLSYVIESATQVNAAGYSYSQTHSQMQSLSSFSSVLISTPLPLRWSERRMRMSRLDPSGSPMMSSRRRVGL